MAVDIAEAVRLFERMQPAYSFRNYIDEFVAAKKQEQQIEFDCLERYRERCCKLKSERVSDSEIHACFGQEIEEETNSTPLYYCRAWDQFVASVDRLTDLANKVTHTILGKHCHHYESVPLHRLPYHIKLARWALNGWTRDVNNEVMALAP